MTKAKKLIIVCCLLCFALVLSFFFLGIYGVFAENGQDQTADEIPKTAYVGDEFEIPVYTYQTGSGDVVAQARVVAPDGSVFGGGKLSIRSVGKYTVEYVVDNAVVKTVSCIAVYRPTDMFTVNKYASVIGVEEYAYHNAAMYPAFSGVQIDLEAGAEVTYAREIDMASKTKNDVFFSALIKPEAAGERDFGQMILTLTDAEDEEVYMTVTASDGNLDSLTTGAVSYVRAGGNGQTAGGLEFKETNWVYNTTDIYGSPAPFSFQAEVWPSAQKYDYTFNLCYDAAENALYLKNGSNQFYGAPYKIVDFDDPSVFGTNTWGGFPSGKAKLSVTFSGFVSESGKGSVIFTEIDGIDLSAEQIADEVAPTVTIDLGGEEQAPNSYVGAEYTVFPVSVYDFFDDNCCVRTEVSYSGLLGADSLDVSVKDGTFVTDKVGMYTIRYYATDRFGNVGTASVSFYCVNEEEEILISGVPEEATVDVFKPVALTDIEQIRAVGGSGKLTIGRTVIDPDGAEIMVEDNTFIPDKVGDYIVRYNAVDYFGTEGTETQVIHVQPVEGPVFIDDAALPDVAVAGFTYKLPQVRAKLCNGADIEDAVVRVFVGGEETAQDSFIAPENTALLTVEYRAYDSFGNYVPLTKNIRVIDGDGGRNQAAYFSTVNGDVTAEETRDAVDFLINSDGAVAFANTLNHNAFTMGMSYVGTEVNFSSLFVQLTDSSDASRSVTMEVEFTPFGLNISAPGTSAIPFQVRSDSNCNYLSITYDNATHMIGDIAGTTLFAIGKDDSGNVFGGFEAGFYMTLRFEGVKAASRLSVTAINNQNFGHKNTEGEPVGDVVAPEIVIGGTYERRMSVGASMTVYPAEAFDVLNQVASLTVSVYATDNVCVLSAAVADREYSVVLDKVGRYRIIYTAEDAVGNRGTAGTTMLVLDSVPPTLTVNGSLQENYRVGDEITLLSFTVSDDLDGVCCDIFLELPNSEMYLLTHYEDGVTTSFLSPSDTSYPNSFKVDEDTFRLEQEGRYVLRYFAYDEHYNYVMKEFVFMVTK